MSCAIGLYGLAVMGQNLALNIAQNAKVRIAVCNRSPSKVDDAVARAKAEGDLPVEGHKDVASFVAALAVPRAVILLVQAGQAVDDTIEVRAGAFLRVCGGGRRARARLQIRPRSAAGAPPPPPQPPPTPRPPPRAPPSPIPRTPLQALCQHLEKGDLIIDGGNEWYPNTLRRGKALADKGILFMGMGVSGGEEGARNGPSLMPGGPREAYDRVRPILEAISAKTDSGACVTYIGELGSGNYVKMVHNGIEYGDMQLIAEAYDILKTVGGLSNEELHETFSAWNAGELNSYLIEITAKIFARKEDDGCVRPPPSTHPAVWAASCASSRSHIVTLSRTTLHTLSLPRAAARASTRWTSSWTARAPRARAP